MLESYGAMIQRGKILSITSEGARIQSLSREGVQTPPLPFLSGFSAKAGELVYFFMFDDGRGMVLSKIP